MTALTTALVVFRVQDAHGCGPYRPKCCPRCPADISDSDRYDKTPIPREDFKWGYYDPNLTFIDLPYLMQLYGYKFAFPTRAAALEWFGYDNLKAMERFGWELVPVPAIDVVVSDSGRQCIFKPMEGL